MISSIAGLLVLAADIWAILNVAQSSATNGTKLVWILVVVLLPVLGVILWFFMGPRGSKIPWSDAEVAREELAKAGFGLTA